MVTITLLDNGRDRYTQESDGKYFGRKYDNISEAFKVVFPEYERNNFSNCVMIIVHSDTTIDHIGITEDTLVDITSNLSQYDKIKVGFSFQKEDGYVKNSEWQYYYFYDALKPDEFVPVEPEQKKKYDLLLDKAFVDVDWKAGTSNVLQWKNIDGEVVKEMNLTGVDDEMNDTSENPVQNKVIKEYVDNSIPKNTSDLANDSGYITKAVADLVNYYTKASIDTTVEELREQISAIPQFGVKVVESLPTTDISKTTIYLVPNAKAETGNYYDEYIYADNNWELIGTTKIDLSDYAKTTDLPTMTILWEE